MQAVLMKCPVSLQAIEWNEKLKKVSGASLPMVEGKMCFLLTIFVVY